MPSGTFSGDSLEVTQQFFPATMVLPLK
jgi:hypothetical protein